MQKKTKKQEGILFVISAPSGAGKTALCNETIKAMPEIKLSVSYTTRKPRPGEVSDVHYTFVSRKRFETMLKKGEFAEWAMVHGNLYGTSLKRLALMCKKGHDTILDIDVHGARQIRRKFKNTVFIFILPPSIEVLGKRLRGRMSDSDEQVRLRLKNAAEEIRDYKNYDYVIINDNLKKALKELESIIIAERLRTMRRSIKWT
ncbi:MAG: guanylate kinase [Nitrospirae bacterium]|nr:guanylate kinase [Nitrospirota bacterium]